MMWHTAFLFTIMVFFSLSGNANPTDPFQKANLAYQKNDFKSAIQLYESILQQGDFSGELHFNLANAYLKNNQIGKAILNYERAKNYDSDESLLTNLKIAEAKKVDQIEPLPPFFVKKAWSDFRDIFSVTGWAVLSLFLLWVGLGLLTHKALTGKELLSPKIFQIAVMASLIAFLICLLMAFAKFNFENNHQVAIVIQKETELKEGADEKSPEKQFLHEGTKIEILDQIEDWYKIRLVDGETGWLNQAHLEII